MDEVNAKKELPACPVETTLTLIGDKWKVLILRDLMPGTRRFGELKKAVPRITNTMLTNALKELEGDGLNLTHEVREGIVCHTGNVKAKTLEGQILWFADRIAYINHDIEDAVRAGVLDPDILPKECTAVLGNTKSERITTMIRSILAHSDGDVGVGAEEHEAFLALKDFMYANVYVDRTAKREEQKVEKVLTELYEYYLTHIDQMSNFYLQLAYQEGRERAVTDYISGMSDEFAIRTFEDVFVPRKWHVL